MARIPRKFIDELDDLAIEYGGIHGTWSDIPEPILIKFRSRLYDAMPSLFMYNINANVEVDVYTLRKDMKEKGVTIRYLSTRMGLSVSTISRKMRGELPFKYRDTLEIKRVMGKQYLN